MTIKLYQVGGSVRDEILGLPVNHDIDFAVEADSWETMLDWAEDRMDKIWLLKPEYLTIRGRIDGIDTDFVLCRKDGTYYDSRHPESVEPGTILDDLARRDFTVNAIAVDYDTKEVLDPHGGTADCHTKTLKCVGSATERFEEDALRILRAIRFMITKNLAPDEEISAIFNDPTWAKKLKAVSTERIATELQRCFQFNTSFTIGMLGRVLHPWYLDALFEDTGIWLLPTTKKIKGH